MDGCRTTTTQTCRYLEKEEEREEEVEKE